MQFNIENIGKLLSKYCNKRKVSEFLKLNIFNCSEDFLYYILEKTGECPSKNQVEKIVKKLIIEELGFNNMQLSDKKSIVKTRKNEKLIRFNSNIDVITKYSFYGQEYLFTNLKILLQHFLELLWEKDRDGYYAVMRAYENKRNINIKLKEDLYPEAVRYSQLKNGHYLYVCLSSEDLLNNCFKIFEIAKVPKGSVYITVNNDTVYSW